jgi:hypothetical protein
MRGRQLLLARTEARHHLLPPLDPAAASLYARGGPHGLRGWGAPMRGRSGLCRGSRACEAKGTHVRCKGRIGRRPLTQETTGRSVYSSSERRSGGTPILGRVRRGVVGVGLGEGCGRRGALTQSGAWGGSACRAPGACCRAWGWVWGEGQRGVGESPHGGAATGLAPACCPPASPPSPGSLDALRVAAAGCGQEHLEQRGVYVLGGRRGAARGGAGGARLAPTSGEPVLRGRRRCGGAAPVARSAAPAAGGPCARPRRRPAAALAPGRALRGAHAACTARRGAAHAAAAAAAAARTPAAPGRPPPLQRSPNPGSRRSWWRGRGTACGAGLWRLGEADDLARRGGGWSGGSGGLQEAWVRERRAQRGGPRLDAPSLSGKSASRGLPPFSVVAKGCAHQWRIIRPYRTPKTLPRPPDRYRARTARCHESPRRGVRGLGRTRQPLPPQRDAAWPLRGRRG